MNNTMKLGLGVGGGYLLGRTKKLKLAVGLGTWLVGRKFEMSPARLAMAGVGQLRQSPEFNEVLERVRTDVAGAGRRAVEQAVTARMEGMTDTLKQRNADLATGAAGAATGAATKGGKAAGGTARRGGGSAGNKARAIASGRVIDAEDSAGGEDEERDEQVSRRRPRDEERDDVRDEQDSYDDAEDDTEIEDEDEQDRGPRDEEDDADAEEDDRPARGRGGKRAMSADEPPYPDNGQSHDDEPPTTRRGRSGSGSRRTASTGRR